MKKIIISIILGLYFLNCLGNISVFAELSDAQLKSIDQPIELCGENKKKAEDSLPEKDLLRNKIFDILKIIENGKDLEKNKKALDEYNKLIKENPEYSDAYFYRAKHLYQFLHSKDYPKIIEDINNAIKFHSSTKYKSIFSSSCSDMYDLRAKINKLMGNYNQVIEDLEKAFLLSKTENNIYKINILSYVKPEEIVPDDEHQMLLWNKKDFDEIINKFPLDYRSYLFRGYYYSNPSFTIYDEKYYTQAVKDYEEAIHLNPANPALIYYLLADCENLSQNMSYEGENKRIQFLNKAIMINSKFKDAYSLRASIYFMLKQYKLDIEDLDKVIELDPENYSAYNFRGNCNVNLENYYEAINDFNKAIKKLEKDCKSGIVLSGLYQNRGDAYNYVHDYNNAIKDFSKAIELELESKIFWPMDIAKFRAIYPEYDKVSNEALSKMLWQKFSGYPKYEDFAKRFIKENEKDGFPVLALLYFNRFVAYLNAGNFRKAIAEYNRPIKADPNCELKIGRWWTLPNSQDRETLVNTKTWEYVSFYKNSKSNREIYIDTKTIEYSENGIVKCWIKTVNNNSQENSEAYSLTKFEIDCPLKMINSIESISYDSSGNALQQSSGNRKQNIVPESIGEMLYKVLCEDANK